MSVNVPTNTKIKDKDVNSKLQLYGIYAAFAQGKVPSNKQIDVAMNSALEWPPMRQPSKKLSAEGQQLVGDVRDVIEKTKLMLLTKNQGNLIQDFIYRTGGIGSGDATKPNAPINKDQAKQHGQDALEGLRTLGKLVITNGQFRKLLSDATILLRDIAGDAASKAAGKVNPSEDELNQIDEPAPDHTWHDTPKAGDLKARAQNAIPLRKKDVQEAAGDAAQSGQPDGSRDPQQAADRAREQGTDAVDPKQGAQAGAEKIKGRMSDRMNDDQKEQMKQYRERANNYFKDKLPKERREQAVFRLKKMIVEIQTHRDYQQAIDTLLGLAEEYQGHTKNLGSQGLDSAKGAQNQSSLQIAQTDLKELLERFANSTSFDDLMDSINQIYRDADNDKELGDWFREIDGYIRKCLKQEGYILEDEANERWTQLYDKGHYLVREKYRGHFDRVLDEFKFLGQQFDEDPENTAFAKSVEKLFQDLGNDQDGKPTFKPHLVKDLTEVLLPGFFEHIRYVPIPRIEYSDPMVDAIVENLVIEGDNLAPNIMEFGSDNYFRWGRRGAQSQNKNKVMLSVSGVQMDLRDVAFYIKKKQGFPSVTDKGVMDIFLGGSGLSFKVAMETADRSDKHHFFKINDVIVDIKNMDIKMKQSNHKLLFGLFKPLLFKVMRPVIQKVVEKQIKDQVQQVDAFLYSVKQRADRNLEESRGVSGTEGAPPNFYQRYSTAFQEEIEKGKREKERQQGDKPKGQTNIAMTQQDSMFKNISLPGGISTKATEYKQLADKGDRWESPVFSIGSASETRSLPNVQKPQRKQHNVTDLNANPADDNNRGNTSNAGNVTNYGNTGDNQNYTSDLRNTGNTGNTYETGNISRDDGNTFLNYTGNASR